MEEGQLFEADVVTSSKHKTAFKWPDESYDLDDLEVQRASKLPLCRFVVIRSSVLSPRHRIASADGFAELHFGRDAASPGIQTPRVRLREMEVSKHHTTVYWDSKRREWNAVDMGSKHGTFIHPRATPSGHESHRLSAPRVASLPRRLKHMDCLSIGNTTFAVHIHDGMIPCEECNLESSSEEIPLFSNPRKPPIARIPVELPSLPATSSKVSLTSLRHTLLARHAGGPRASTPPAAHYIDRSARRRALQPSSRLDAPGIAIPVVISSVEATPSPKPVEVKSDPPVPIPQTNIGHRLLMQQGWSPGTALGTNGEGRLDPLNPENSVDRAGLGMPQQHNWKTR